jgi:hypothetical protein
MEHGIRDTGGAFLNGRQGRYKRRAQKHIFATLWNTDNSTDHPHSNHESHPTKFNSTDCSAI